MGNSKPGCNAGCFQADYTWLAQVYQSVRPVSTGGSLIWTLLGAKTIEIIHRNIDTIDIGTPLEDLVVDGDVIDMVLEQAKDNPKRYWKWKNASFEVRRASWRP